jgi:hypothetical protein
MKYYLLTFKYPEGTAFADTTGETPIAFMLIEQLKGKTKLPFALQLKKVSMGKKGVISNPDISGVKHRWMDYQPNHLAWPLMSERMKKVVADNLGGKEKIEWIEAEIIAGKEQRAYYIPRFKKKLEVLDREKTVFVKGTDHVSKPCFAAEKVLHYELFHGEEMFWQITSALYVSEKMKETLIREKISGTGFEEVWVS